MFKTLRTHGSKHVSFGHPNYRGTELTWERPATPALAHLHVHMQIYRNELCRLEFSFVSGSERNVKKNLLFRHRLYGVNGKRKTSVWESECEEVNAIGSEASKVTHGHLMAI